MMKHRLPLFICAICLMVTSQLSAGHHKKDESAAGDKPAHIDLKLNGKPILRYMCAFDASTPESLKETYKVYAHILDENGEPITKGAGGKFPHHRGLYIGWAKLQLDGQKLDTWHMKKTTQQHVKVLEQTETRLKTAIHWMKEDGSLILEEERTHEISNEGSYITVNFTSTLKATAGDILLAGDPEHAGMQFRPHNDVVANKSAKYTFPGDVTTKNVKKHKDLTWAAMSFKLRDQDWTVQHINHAANPKGSVYSAYRDYGRFGCFHNKVPIKKGESLTLNFTIRVMKGAAPAVAELDKAYSEANK